MKSKRAVIFLIGIVTILCNFNYYVNAAEKIKLNKTSITLSTGEKYKLKLLNTTKKVSWKSKNTNIATINNNGTVSAKKVGVTKVYAKVGSKTYNCTVKINKKSFSFKYLDNNWSSIGPISEGLISVKDASTGLWGYIDKKGNYVVQPNYYNVFPFSEGLATVQTEDGYYSFINKNGAIVIENKYKTVDKRFHNEVVGFKNGLAYVENPDNIYMLIDRNGNIVKEEKINTSEYIYNGHLIVRGNRIYNNQYEVINEFAGKNDSLFNTTIKYLIFKDGNEFYIAGNNGIVLKLNQLDLGEGSFKVGITNDYIVVQKTFNGTTMSALYNLNGNLVLDFKYKIICPLSKNLICVSNNGDKWAVINSSDKEIIPFSKNIDSINGGGRYGNCDTMYSELLKTGSIYYISETKSGAKKAEYYSVKDNKIYNSFAIDIYGYKIHSFYYTYSDGTNRLFFENTLNNGTHFNVYDPNGKLITSIKKNIISINKSELQDFLKENILPDGNKLIVFR